jgi:hypothetical protein
MTTRPRATAIAEPPLGKDNLLGEGIYWELGQRGPFQKPFPKGTLGGLLFRLYLLDALARSLTPEQTERARAVRDKARAELQHWRVQAEQKAVREIASRMRTWSGFVDEAAGDPGRHRSEYPSQVENRVILDFLLNFAGTHIDDAARSGLAVADRRLDSVTTQGDFVWDAALRDAFPAERFPGCTRRCASAGAIRDLPLIIL